MRDNLEAATLGFLLKVVLVSALLSGLIKYAGTWLPDYALATDFQNSYVLAIVVAPSLALGCFLLLRMLADR